MKTYNIIWYGEEWTISCEENEELSFDENGNIKQLTIYEADPSVSAIDIGIGFHPIQTSSQTSLNILPTSYPLPRHRRHRQHHRRHKRQNR